MSTEQGFSNRKHTLLFNGENALIKNTLIEQSANSNYSNRAFIAPLGAPFEYAPGLDCIDNFRQPEQMTNYEMSQENGS